jgi:hypothetical protein
MTQDDDDDEAFENGVLRDGARRRVPLQMLDSRAPLVTDGTSDPLGLHRPGWRIASGGSESDVVLRDSQRRLCRGSTRGVLRSAHQRVEGQPVKRTAARADLVI